LPVKIIDGDFTEIDLAYAVWSDLQRGERDTPHIRRGRRHWSGGAGADLSVELFQPNFELMTGIDLAIRLGVQQRAFWSSHRPDRLANV
jgi:hypothetical protein